MTNKIDDLLKTTGDLSFRRRVKEIFGGLDIQPNDIILDVGCGEGFYTYIISKLYKCTVYAIDDDPKILNMAQNRLEKNPKVKFTLGGINKLPFKNSFFDKIICSEVLEHIPDELEKPALEELYRVLKPKGVMAITVPNSNFPLLWDPINKVREFFGLGHFNPRNCLLGGIWSFDHKRLYSVIQLRNLLERKYKVLDIKCLTRYGIPFNYQILYIGKWITTNLLKGGNIKAYTEKFTTRERSVEATKKSLVVKMISIGFSLIKWIDTLNERKLKDTEPAMNIYAKVTKI